MIADKKNGEWPGKDGRLYRWGKNALGKLWTEVWDGSFPRWITAYLDPEDWPNAKTALDAMLMAEEKKEPQYIRVSGLPDGYTVSVSDGTSTASAVSVGGKVAVDVSYLFTEKDEPQKVLVGDRFRVVLDEKPYMERRISGSKSWVRDDSGTNCLMAADWVAEAYRQGLMATPNNRLREQVKALVKQVLELPNGFDKAGIVYQSSVVRGQDLDDIHELAKAVQL